MKLCIVEVELREACSSTMCKSLFTCVSSEKNRWLTTQRFDQCFYSSRYASPEDDQSILIETLSRLPPVLFRTNTTQKRFSYGVTKNLS